METRVKGTQSEISMESSRTRLLQPLRSQSQDNEIRLLSTRSDLAMTPWPLQSESPSESDESESESGYTTESSYRTVTGYELLPQSSSYASSQNPYAAEPADFLWEIYVPIHSRATAEDIQTVHGELRELLASEMHLMGGANGPVIYLIAYSYM
ncbi:uncharacterized protein LOC6732773 [Drosophila simulans]|uniref:GD24183 n=1 Tax=Drosophila simulans TaxID=7240 RepID=B4Q9G4_DROSI|nr:uncharacterized protein LOC6732773 [Drosophila simulans]EDX05471.1 GD24183 [Drosophila simulans]KMY90942.1 uncharacterized protein Dsimw501_GD24183 [Drosophila simulans]